MSELLERTQHHYDVREFRGLPLREPLFFLDIAPLPARSGVEKNVAAASSQSPIKSGIGTCQGRSAGNSRQKLRSARPE